MGLLNTPTIDLPTMTYTAVPIGGKVYEIQQQFLNEQGQLISVKICNTMGGYMTHVNPKDVADRIAQALRIVHPHGVLF